MMHYDYDYFASLPNVFMVWLRGREGEVEHDHRGDDHPFDKAMK